MKKTYILLIFMVLMIMNFVKADICSSTVTENTNCNMITPIISCTNYTYSIFNQDGSLNDFNSLQYYAGGMYNFTFNENIGNYTVILCDGFTRFMTVTPQTNTSSDLNFTSIPTLQATSQTYDLNYNNYMDINSSQHIFITTSNIITDENAELFIENQTINFSKTNYSFDLYLSSINENDINYSINITNTTTGNLTKQFNGVFKFRKPYYITIQLYSEDNTTFKTNFNYLYLKNLDTTSTTTYSALGSAFSTGILGWISSASRRIDYTEVFWGEVIGNEAVIKLYDTGNYSVTLLSLKTFKPDAWEYEFIKPQYTKSKVETTIDSSLYFGLKTDGVAKIRLSSYEVLKSDFFFNIFKWTILLVITMLLLIASFYSPSPLYGLGGTLIILLVLAKILGVHL